MSNSLNILFLMIISIINFPKLFCSSINKHSTKTAYLDSFSQQQIDFLNKIENYKIENCVPKQLYIFLRHGSRYPNKKHVQKSKDFLESFRLFRQKQHERNVSLPKTVFDEIFVTFDDKPNHGLSELGALEMKLIAQRFKKRYPSLFRINSNEDLSNINIISSDKERCIDSGRNFINGLFDNVEEKNLISYFYKNMILNNTLIRTFDNCERYQMEVKKDKFRNVDLIKFKNGAEMMQIKESLLKKNFLNEFDFDVNLLSKFYGLCGIEHTHRMRENWCKLFDEKHLVVLSYLSDLKDYWVKSYGNDINSKVVLFLFQDLFENINKMIKNEPIKHKVLLRFGHAENIIPLITALDLFKDENGLKYDKLEENHNRLFKAEVFSPFAANIAFVLHKCQDSEDENSYDNYKIKVLVNELPVGVIRAGVLMCSLENGNIKLKESLCNLTSFKSQMSGFMSYDLEESCKIREPSNIKSDL